MGLGKGRLQGFGFVEEAVVLAEAFQRGEAEVFVEEREIDAEKLGALDVGESVVGAPKAFEFGQDRLHQGEWRLPADLGAVGGGVFEGLEIGGVGEADFENPAGAEGIGVEERGVGFDGVVAFHDLTADG